MKRKITITLLSLLLVAGVCSLSAREQWTVEQAWQWQERVGVIKGFNEPYPAYPGMSRADVLKKAHDVGLNSVRFWVRGETAEEQIAHIRQMIDEADRYGMTVSPVLNYVKERFARNRGNQPMKDYERVTRAVVCMERAALIKAPLIIAVGNAPTALLRLCQLMEEEENLSQPITSSIIWATVKEDSKPLKRMAEVEGMMDIHNFHYYNCALDFGKHVYDMMDLLQAISPRPMVATECLTRTNGSGIARTFDAFSRYKVNFYIWGLYVNDRNWEARWERSTYDPYDPENGESLYPPLEVTDRWSHERAWRWMATGPLKGFVAADGDVQPAADGYNAVKVRLSYDAWQADTASFFHDTDALLDEAQAQGLAVMPMLLTDDDFDAPHPLLAEYVGSVVGRYYCDTRIKAWELYHHPGERVKNTAALSRLVSLIFRHARNQYANQPLTMTPYVQVQAFEPGFDYWGAMVHGRTAGWDRLAYGGGSTAELCYRIWSLSDVVSFSSVQAAPEAGWLASICYRFGRPVFCTGWTAPGDADVEALLERFATSHVFWFSEGNALAADQLSAFRFKQTSTQRQVVEGFL